LPVFASSAHASFDRVTNITPATTTGVTSITPAPAVLKCHFATRLPAFAGVTSSIALKRRPE